MVVKILENAKIRLATPDDAAAILEIYKYYILNTAITFEVEEPAPADFRRRVENILAAYPFLVFEAAGNVVAYAYAHRYLARAAYDRSAQFSVYVRQDYCGHCIGTALYTALREICRLQNVQNVYGLVADKNPQSIALHQKLGFERLGTYSRIGYKFDKWHDVSIFQMILGDHQTPAPPFIPTGELPQAKIAKILTDCRPLAKI